MRKYEALEGVGGGKTLITKYFVKIKSILTLKIKIKIKKIFLPFGNIASGSGREMVTDMHSPDSTRECSISSGSFELNYQILKHKICFLSPKMEQEVDKIKSTLGQ